MKDVKLLNLEDGQRVGIGPIIANEESKTQATQPSLAVETPPTPVVNSTQLEPLLPPDVEDPEPILYYRNVDCYVSGLLASFPRETFNKMVHEILIDYQQSDYAIEKERPILHQRCGGRPGKST